MTLSLRTDGPKLRYPSFGYSDKQFSPVQSRRQRRSTVNHLDCYTSAISILRKQKSKSKLDYLRGKYVGTIDKNYINQIKNKQLVFKQSCENSLNDQKEQGQATKISRTRRKNVIPNIQQSPYVKLKQQNKFYSEVTQRKPAYQPLQNLKQSKKKNLKLQKVRESNNKILRCQSSGLKKIKKRIRCSSVARLQSYLDHKKGWVKHMTAVYSKEQKQRKLLKQKIICRTNIT